MRFYPSCSHDGVHHRIRSAAPYFTPVSNGAHACVLACSPIFPRSGLRLPLIRIRTSLPLLSLPSCIRSCRICTRIFRTLRSIVTMPPSSSTSSLRSTQFRLIVAITFRTRVIALTITITRLVRLMVDTADFRFLLSHAFVVYHVFGPLYASCRS